MAEVLQVQAEIFFFLLNVQNIILIEKCWASIQTYNSLNNPTQNCSSDIRVWNFFIFYIVISKGWSVE